MIRSTFDVRSPSVGFVRLLCGICVVLAVLTGLAIKAPAAKADEPGSQFVSVTPVRFVDTNNGTGGSSSPLGAAATRSYTVPGLPSNATAVLLDVAATSATVDSSLRIWPYGESMPSGTSVLAIESTQLPDSNSVIVPLGTNKKISVWNGNGSVDFNLDLHGYFVPSDGTAGFHALTAERIVDSPAGLGVTGPTITAGTAYDIQVTGATVPAGATAIFANIKLSSATVEGGLRVAKGGTSLSGLPSALNFDAGVTTDSGITIPLSSAGKLRLASTAASGTVKIYIDVQGYFAPGDGAEFHVGSQNVLVNNVTIPGGSETEILAAGQAGLPSDGSLGAVVVTAFVSNWAASGGVSLSNADDGASNLSNVSFTTSMDAGVGANSTAIVPVSDEGKLVVSNKSTGSVVVRLTAQGWFSNRPPAIPIVTSVTAGGGNLPKVTGSVADPELNSVSPIVVVKKGTKTVLRVPGASVASGAPFSVTLPALYTGSYEISVIASDGKSESDESAATTIDVVGEDQGATRAVSSGDEPSFLSRTVDLGIDEDLAKIAVWNAPIADALPVEMEVTDSDEDVDLGTPTEPAPSEPVSDDEPPFHEPYEPPDGVVYPASAADGDCPSGYRYYKYQHQYTLKSHTGIKLFTIKMSRRWCGSKTRHGKISSQWTSSISATITTAASYAGWKAGGTDEPNSRWYRWDGNDKGAHYYSRRKHMKFCPGNTSWCDDLYLTIRSWVYRDGGKYSLLSYED